jgi:hypothetical protein
MNDMKQKIIDNLTREEDGCWAWIGYVSPDGYGYVYDSITKRTRGAHRVSYETFVGPVPDDLELDHLCRVRHCVNPEHLEPVTTRENTLRGESFAAREARQTHCIHGHELTPENSFSRTYLPRQRECIVCRNARNRAYRARTKDKRRLSEPQQRHLAELAVIYDDKGTAFWTPANQGEQRCATVLARRGLLRGISLTRSRPQYELTKAGRSAVGSPVGREE